MSERGTVPNYAARSVSAYWFTIHLLLRSLPAWYSCDDNLDYGWIVQVVLWRKEEQGEERKERVNVRRKGKQREEADKNEWMHELI